MKEYGKNQIKMGRNEEGGKEIKTRRKRQTEGKGGIKKDNKKDRMKERQTEDNNNIKKSGRKMESQLKKEIKR